MFDDDSRAMSGLYAKFMLHGMEKEYLETDNPMFAWDAIWYCCGFNWEFPAWLRSYLNQSAASIREYDSSNPGIKTGKYEPERVGRMLGFVNGKGGRSKKEEFYDAYFKKCIHMLVKRQIAKGEKEYIAFEKVSEEVDRSVSTVRRAYSEIENSSAKGS